MKYTSPEVYEKISQETNTPTDIRHERRFMSRTQRQLHIRSCSKTGEEILSIYPEDVSFPVYSQKAYKDHMYR